MPSPTNAIIPKFVSAFKRYSNKKCQCSIWQRGYHDHIIRSEDKYKEIWEYVDINPLKWKLDCYHV